MVKPKAPLESQTKEKVLEKWAAQADAPVAKGRSHATERIGLRITPEQAVILDRLANNRGVGRATVLKILMMEEAERKGITSV